MINLSTIRRILVGTVVAVAAAAALAVAPESGNASVRFSDGSQAYVALGCFDNGGRRWMQGAAANPTGTLYDTQPTYVRLWVWDRVSDYQLFGQGILVDGWFEVRDTYFLVLTFGGPRLERWVYAEYYRVVNGRGETRGEWLTLKNGARYVQSCFL